MKYKHLLLFIIFGLGIIVRFYNFSNRVTFGPEQAISLITSGRMITEKFSLLGDPNVQRINSQGQRLYTGALFNYSLVPLQILFNFNPLKITFYFCILIILTGLFVYKIAYEIFDKVDAMFASVIFMLSAVTINHSLFIWNQNYNFLIGLLTYYFLFKLDKKKSKLYIFVLGLLSGMGVSTQYFYLFTFILVLCIIFLLYKSKIVGSILYLLGALLPNLPTLIFDIRHNYLHVLTVWRYFLDVIEGTTKSSVSYYHFLQFFPIIVILLGVALKRIYLRNKAISLSLLTLFVYLNINSSLVNFKAPTGMPNELTINTIFKAAEAIKEDSPKDFNVAVLVDFDTRGHILRYPLEFKYGLKAMGVEEYPSAKRIYVLADKSYDFENPGVWELSSYKPYDVDKLASVGNDYAVFKLEK